MRSIPPKAENRTVHERISRAAVTGISRDIQTHLAGSWICPELEAPGFD